MTRDAEARRGSETFERAGDASADSRERAPGAPGEDLVGRRLLHFRVVERLGAGGMGIVYRAVDERLKRPVALKVLSRRYVHDERNKALLFREARSAAAARHASIAGIYELYDDVEPAFIVMELAEGETLRARLRRGAMRADEALFVGRQIASALARAHAVGVVHRDLKPENVMLAEGQVKVLDFGLAKIARDADAGPPSGGAWAEPEATAHGKVMGTPAYMAPEQARGEAVDARADVFAFGVVMYEMLAGAAPFERASADPSDWGDAGSRDWRTREPVARACRGGGRALRRVIERCLAHDAGARFANGAELARAIDAAAASGRRSSRMAAGGAIAVGVLAVAVFSGARALRSASSPAPAPAPSGVAVDPVAAGELAAGVQSWRDGSSSAARRHLEMALARDPSLASAELRLAMWNGPWRQRGLDEPARAARAHAQKAEALRARLSDSDRALLDAVEPAFRQIPDVAEEASRLAALAAGPSPTGEALVWLAQTRGALRDVPGALDALARAVRVDPGLEPVVHAERALALRADAAAALAEYDACLARWPEATDCLAGRALLHDFGGACAAEEADANAWVSADPDDRLAYEALSGALYATGAPIAAVREASSAAVARYPEAQREEAGATQRYALAMAGGDFAEAQAAARALGAGAGGGPGVVDHWVATLDLAIALLEAGDAAGAGNVAADFLARARAWTPGSVREMAMPLMFLGIAFKTGHISEAELAAQREHWLTLARAALARAGVSSAGAFTWISAYGVPTRDAATAKAALDALPDYLPLPAPTSTDASTSLVIANVYALAGRDADARPYLVAATRACGGLSQTYAMMRARYLDAQVLARAGARDEARAMCRAILDRWGNARPRSVTADGARALLAKL